MSKVIFNTSSFSNVGVRYWEIAAGIYLFKFHKMMKMYARSILDILDKTQSSSVELFQTLGWMTVEVHLNYWHGKFNFVHSNRPSYLTEMFQTVNHIYIQQQI